MGITVQLDDPDAPDARALLQAGYDLMRSLFPGKPQAGFSTAPLRAPDTRFFTAREGGAAVGCCALTLHPGFAEIRRMYVAPQARGSGVAARLLQAVEAAARQERCGLLRLESGVRLTDAHRLYVRHGFVPCGAFGSHAEDPASLFMEKRLVAAG